MLKIFTLILAPFVSLFIFTLGNGFSITLTTIRLHYEASSSLLIGIISGAYYAGLAIGSFNIERSIVRVGHIRVFAAFASILSIMGLLQGIFVNPYLWILFRFIAGFATAGLFIVIESWLLTISAVNNRGQVLAFYMVALYAGQSLGQFFMDVADPTTLLAFVIVGILSSLAVIPLTLIKSQSPVFEQVSTLSFKKLYNTSGSGVLGSFAAGLILGAVYTMLPLFISQRTGSTTDVASLMFMVILGGMFLQYPVGRLSDVVERRKVLIGVSALTMVISLIMPLLFQKFNLTYLLIFIFGGLTFTIYPVSVSYACDNLSSKDLVAGTQGLLLAYSIGATIGPIISPLFMRFFGINGLFIYYSVVSLILTIAFLWLRRRRVAVPQEENFIPFPQTTPIVSELDPRSEAEGVAATNEQVQDIKQ